MKLKLKDKIKNSLMDWLGVTDLDKSIVKINKNLDDSYKSNRNLIDNFISETTVNKKNISYNKNSIDRLHKTIESVVHIGTDVDMGLNQNHSWAVICVEGNMNLVKFIDLNGKNIREISSFLKQFEAGRHCIDAPYKIFYDEMFTF